MKFLLPIIMCLSLVGCGVEEAEEEPEEKPAPRPFPAYQTQEKFYPNINSVPDCQYDSDTGEKTSTESCMPPQEGISRSR